MTQKTAWFMIHRIRIAMKAGSIEKLVDDVEVDETYIGGKSRNMQAFNRAQRIKGTGMVGKTVVVGLLGRSVEVMAQVVREPKKKTLHKIVKDEVLEGSRLYTDALRSYTDLGE